MAAQVKGLLVLVALGVILVLNYAVLMVHQQSSLREARPSRLHSPIKNAATVTDRHAAAALASDSPPVNHEETRGEAAEHDSEEASHHGGDAGDTSGDAADTSGDAAESSSDAADTSGEGVNSGGDSDSLDSVKAVAERVAKDGVVIMVMGSKEYLDMLQNWAISLERLGLGSHFIVFAQDANTVRFCKAYWPKQFVSYRPSVLDGLPASVAHANDTRVYGSKSFFAMQVQRPLYIRHLLLLGFSVLLSDIDMVWQASPFPFLSPSLPFDVFLTADDAVPFGPSWSDDLPHPLTQHFGPQHGRKFGCILCTCFLLFRPNARALLLLDAWIESLLRRGYSKQVHSLQNHFNLVIQSLVANGTDVRIGLLPPGRFPSGIASAWRQVVAGRRRVGVSPVVVHANYVYGRKNKVVKLRQAGVWLVGWEEEEEGGTAMRRLDELERSRSVP